MARLRRLSRIQASRSASLSHYSRQPSALQPFLDSDFFDCPVFDAIEEQIHEQCCAASANSFID